MALNAPEQLRGPELFFALVGAVGTDLDLVSTILHASLAEANYRSEEIRLSSLLDGIPREPWSVMRRTPEDQRYHDYMNGGNELRKTTKRGDALAVLAIKRIRELRATEPEGEPTKPIASFAYVLRSLKHPKEVEALRMIYGQSFFLVGAYSPRQIRLHALAQKIANSYYSNRTDEYLKHAHGVNNRDEEEGLEFGQNVRDTFPLADVFVNADDREELKRSIDRFIDILFSYPYHTPTKDEYGMFHAQAAALRSSSLSRQVGAVITTESGDIVAVGTNEVNRAGGGLYWSDDKSGKPDFVLGYDTSEQMKRNTLAELLSNLKQAGWLAPALDQQSVDDLLKRALDGQDLPRRGWEAAQPPETNDRVSVTNGTQLMNLIEFGRAEHAETAALLDAARRGVALKDSTLYTTTFPCHDCARHIVTAGINRVTYIQPYPKSLALELHSDSLAIDPPYSEHSKVNFVPFVGISPRRYMDLFSFSKNERKQKDGKKIDWKKAQATPRFAEPSGMYRIREDAEYLRFRSQMIENGLMVETNGGD